PESRRDLSVSYARLAQIAEANSDKALAIHYFLQGLEYAKIYQLKQQCPDADQLIAFFEREIQRLQMIND
ncbi:MAG: hypothetical protein KAH22_10945, partial [Thiotrichaceae bacterium]|nr:hypothetical protein [Thiotrichaceae bacterium]